MPERPKRPKTPTVVVRTRGPTNRQRLVMFLAMLVIVTGFGMAVVIVRRPAWLGLGPSNSTGVVKPNPSVPTPLSTTAVATTTMAPTTTAPATTTAASTSARPKATAPKPTAPPTAPLR